jgi:hypothetical protein
MARIIVAIITLAVSSPQPVLADAVVGTGTPSSCTEAALNVALGCGPTGNCSGGGNVTFNCGASPVTITVTSARVMTGQTSIDGGGLVTLSGGSVTPLFSVSPGATCTLANLTISAGGGGSAISNSGALTVTNCTFSGNIANDGGGAIFNEGMLRQRQEITFTVCGDG